MDRDETAKEYAIELRYPHKRCTTTVGWGMTDEEFWADFAEEKDLAYRLADLWLEGDGHSGPTAQQGVEILNGRT